MAKQVILDVLKSTIGKYVLNLDAESLSVALWSGKIELHSLDLNLDAVNAELDRQAREAPNLAIPFRVVGGGFDSIQVDVPWARLSSRPVVLRAKGLHVTVQPYNRRSPSPSGNEKNKRGQKVLEERFNSIKIYNEYRLQANAIRKLAAVQDDETTSIDAAASKDNKEGEEQQQSFTSRLVRRIIENLQVEIENVHVAFQNNDCSAGILLKSLSLVTTTKDGERTFVDRTVTRTNSDNQDEESFLYKVLSINGFGIYLDQHAGQNQDSNNNKNNNKTVQKRNETNDHSYILKPLSFEAKLRQSDAARCVNFPKYLLSSQLPNLSLELTKNQLENIVRVQEVISSSLGGTDVLFPEYRPLSSISKQTAKEWWKYAFRCVRRLSGKRMWVEFILAFKKKKRYLQLYRRHIYAKKCSWMSRLSKKELDELTGLEGDRSISIAAIMAWKNIVDAQAELEIKKHNATKKGGKKAQQSSPLFGSAADGKKGDGPPITLTIEEMKELEAISLKQAADMELSDDSQLCDVEFVLNAFEARLVNHNNKPIVNVEMGTVSTSFKANADGSLEFHFQQASMDVWDACTPDTQFPTVLRNLTNHKDENAFEMKYEKSNGGDQELSIKIAAVELVASPLLTVQMKRFFNVSAQAATGDVKKQDPLVMQKSLTGSEVDIFYDAQTSFEQSSRGTLKRLVDSEMAAQAVSDLSNAMVEAWKNKTKEKAVWKIHCDIHAPVLIVPDDCSKLDSPAIIFDLGHLKFGYGKSDFATHQVETWCNEQANLRRGMALLDTGVLELTSLTLSCATVKEIAASGNAKNLGNAVIEPVSAKLNLGILSFTEEQEAPSVCILGVFPSLCFRMSPAQVSVALQVVSRWQQVGVELGVVSNEQENHGGGTVTAREGAPKSSHTMRIKRSSAEAPKAQEEEKSKSIVKEKKDLQVTFHMQVSLQRLSTYFYAQAGDGIECHLVSVTLSSSQMASGNSSNRLCMGWFWILDMLKTQAPRRQRLLAHSNLPRSAEKMASDQNFEILTELTDMGVFNDQYPVPSDLADISFTSPPPSKDDQDLQDIFLAKAFDAPTVPVLEAKFTSLFIHWNPSAVKMIFNTINETMSSLGIEPQDDDSSSQNPKVVAETRPNKATGAAMLIKANMEQLQVCLNSARDDLPLFFITMSDANVLMVSKSNAKGESMLLSLGLGDVSVAAPPTLGNPAYQTLLGLAPGRSQSLLTVKFFSGQEALKVREPSQDDLTSCEAVADIKLSPMKFVHLQARVMTLVEYATEGILGALFQQAATSAASAAIEIVSTENAEKIFNIAAEGFDVILPQSAVSDNHFALRAGDLNVKYLAFPDPGGGKAHISLGELSLHDHTSSTLVKAPIHMGIDVQLKPLGIGSLEDQAILVDLSISKASFVLLKHQYAQIMNMLAENIGETDPFLRAQKQTVTKSSSSDESTKAPVFDSVTHSGIKKVENTIVRLYTTVKVEILSLEICSDSTENPLVSLSAVQTAIKMNLFPDKEQMVVELALHDLTCGDLRPIAAGRPFRSIIEQNHKKGKAKQDLFLVSFVKDDKERRSETKLTVGAPRLVLMPDIIPDILSFLTLETDESPGDREPTAHTRVARDAEAIEVSYDGNYNEDDDDDEGEQEKMIVSVKTAGCQIMLVDFGPSQATESIVLQGQIKCDLELDKDINSGEERTRFEIRGDHFEMYTAQGKNLLSPLQILEPTCFAVVYHCKSDEMELKAIVLSDFDATISMQNIALVNTIVSSLAPEENKNKKEEDVPLTPNEVARLEGLASALEGAGSPDESVRSLSIHGPETTAATKDMSNAQNNKWKIRLTIPKIKVSFVNDLQGLDEPLIRIGANNIVGGLEGVQPTFEGHINCTLSADYFDPSVHLWNRLLVKPWEFTVKTDRRVSQRFTGAPQLSTILDIESFPCFVSISDQFLISINSANTMWSIYTKATTSALENAASFPVGHEALAANAARNMITSLPYGVENNCGMQIEFAKLHGKSQTGRVACAPGTIQHFRFDPPPGKGYGGKRLYGQDVSQLKRVQLFIGEEEITIDHLDAELGKPRVCHQLKNGWTLLTEVKRSAKSVILCVGSYVDLVNKTSIPFAIDVKEGTNQRHVGVSQGRKRSLKRTSSPTGSHATLSNESDRFGIPLDLLATANSTTLLVSPQVPGFISSEEVYGEITVPGVDELTVQANETSAETVYEVTCVREPTGDNDKNPDPFVVLVRFRVSLVGTQKFPFAQLSLEPRALLINKIPTTLSVRTPMPHTFVSAGKNDSTIEKSVSTHTLAPNDSVEIFTQGPSLPISLKCANQAVSGGSTDWIQGIDLPMMREFRLSEPIKCTFPFCEPKELPTKNKKPILGSEFYVLEASEDMSENILEQIEGLSEVSGKKESQEPSVEGVEVQTTKSPGEAMRSYLITVSNYGIDHTGSLNFEQVAADPSQSGAPPNDSLIRRLAKTPTSTPFSTFATRAHGYRLSLLPGSHSFLRLLEADQESKKSLPFRIEDVSICDGGIEATPLRWDNQKESGYYLYRILVNSYQSELHVIPDFIIYNASKVHRVHVRQVGAETVVGPEKTSPIKTHPKLGLVISLGYQDLGGQASPVRVDSLGHSVAILKSLENVPLGSVVIQTVVGSFDSRFVVKIGEIQFGQKSDILSSASTNMFSKDIISMRIRWSKLNVTLNDDQKSSKKDQKPLALSNETGQSQKLSAKTEREHAELGTQPVCTIVFQRFTIDWQRTFKENNAKQSNKPLLLQERSQLSVIIHHVQLLDESANSLYPVVFDSESNSISLFDLCIRLQGPLDADIVKVDLFDLNLAHAKGKSDKIIIRTTEDFVWNLLDVADRISSATSQAVSVDVKLEWNEDRQKYHVIVEERLPQTGAVFEKPTTYTPPTIDTLYDIAQARVSPCSIVVTFERQPNASRYKEIQGAKLMNYFMRRLKFTLKNAELKFSHYVGHNIRGPPSRLGEILSTVYVSRLKMKIVSILAATSVQDWKYLADRDTGGDGLAEGDYMRVTGNLAGNTASYIVGGVGSGIGDGVGSATSFLGDGIENVSSKIGARAVGAGINSTISGIGGGIGSVVKGVGSGAGKVLKGAGKGVGKVVGGVTGAVVLSGKGIQKGITKGDGRAFLRGFAEGGASIVKGVGDGVETVVMETADGVLTVGRGTASGVGNVGKGLVGGYTQANKKKSPKKTQEKKGAQT